MNWKAAEAVSANREVSNFSTDRDSPFGSVSHNGL
jgi:hypothetical protein